MPCCLFRLRLHTASIDSFQLVSSIHTSSYFPHLAPRCSSAHTLTHNSSLSDASAVAKLPSSCLEASKPSQRSQKLQQPTTLRSSKNRRCTLLTPNRKPAARHIPELYLITANNLHRPTLHLQHKVTATSARNLAQTARGVSRANVRAQIWSTIWLRGLQVSMSHHTYASAPRQEPKQRLT